MDKETIEKKNIEWVHVLSGIFIVVIAVILGFIINNVLDLSKSMAFLQKDVENLKIKQFENQISNLKDRIKEMEDRFGTRSEEIPITLGWKAEGPGAVGMKLRENEDIIELQADLKGAKSFVELFLDLRTVLLSTIDRNSNNSIDLSGRTLIAIVRSTKDFRGDPNHPNGVQFILKTNEGNNIDGFWIDISDTMVTPHGMKVFFKVPYNNSLSKNVTGISLKFTIGSDSSNSFNGSFLIKNIEIASI